MAQFSSGVAVVTGICAGSDGLAACQQTMSRQAPGAVRPARLYFGLRTFSKSSAPDAAGSRRWLGFVVLLGLAFSGWLLFGARKRDPASASSATAADDPTRREATATESRPAPATRGASAPDPVPHHDLTGGDRDRHPHPITPEHTRMQNDNQMLGALNDAIDVKDPKRLRQLVEVWKAKHHDDPERYADAYTVIADCLEVPG